MPARRSTTATRPAPAPDPTSEARKPGRPRSEDCCRAIRGAALELLVEHGFAAVTIESIAARAGVGKATVYRRWPSKAELVVHAFFETVTPALRFVDTGDVREDFRRQMRLAVREMRGPNGRVLATILACMQMDAGLAEAFRTRWLEVRRAEGRRVLERAIERGDLPTDTDPSFVLDALYSPLHFRMLAGHAPLTNELVDDLVDVVFDGLAARRAAAARSARTSTRTSSRTVRKSGGR